MAVNSTNDPRAEPRGSIEPNLEAELKSVHAFVTLHGRRTLPAHGSAAGIWFYHAGPEGSQLLWTGHPDKPDSWRMTASLKAGDEVRVTFDGGGRSWTNVQFQTDGRFPEGLDCRAESNALVIAAGAEPGAASLTGFAFRNVPAAFVPERRPFSREPVGASPDPHPAIADALVEWDWRMQDGIQTPRERRTYQEALAKLLPQIGALVAERTRSQSVAPEDQAMWEDLAKRSLEPTEETAAWEARWLEVHRLRRRIVLSNPLFNGTPLVFVKHVPSVMSHQLTQVYGYCARPGGGLFILREPGQTMRTRDLTPPTLPAGNFMTPELSYDAQKVFFAYCPVTVAPAAWDFNEETRDLRYHVYELAFGSGNLRRLTEGDHDNFSPVCLPSGDLLFVSSRRGGYHRCGRGPCFVYTLARMDADGRNAQTISFHETHEWDPSLLNDGRVIYTRWDYVDRNAVHYQQLWSTHSDGGQVRAYYGNNTWNPTGVWEARAVPGSAKVMATAAPHHGLSAGSIILLDTASGVDGPEPLTRLTPDVRFPESESPLAFGPPADGSDFDTPARQYWRSPLLEPWAEAAVPDEEKRWPGHCYKSPWPLSEKFFIVSYSFDRLVGEPGPNIPNMFGLYLADAFGNKELLYRDPAISSLWARPMVKRASPPQVVSATTEPARGVGTFFLSDINESWPPLPRERSIKHLRIIQVLIKTTPNADSPRVGAAFAAPGKQVLGTVPVEADGSAYFEVPARTPVLFQALDAKGRAVQTMRSLVYLQPGETQSCVGCHEHRRLSPPHATVALAARRAPSKLIPGPDGTRPFSYPRLVQPVLDRHCVRCHDGHGSQRPVLTGEPEGAFSKSYNALVKHVSFSAWNRPEQNFEPLTQPLRFGTLGSPLTERLRNGPCRVRLTPEEEERLFTWMDANALFYGTFDVTEQQKQRSGEAIDGPDE